MNLDRVTAIIQNVVDSLVMPSFQMLRPEDIQSKDTPGDPEDLVTIVDKAAERALIEQLTGIVPDAAFVGEEAVSEHPELLSALSSPMPAWLIDPIDGTKNFARGNRDFGIMVALVEDGLTRASWMAVPAAQSGGYLVVAARGRGTTIDGVPVTTTRQVSVVSPRHGPYEDDASGRRSRRGEQPPWKVRRPSLDGFGSHGVSAILRGDKDFVIYYRLLPWDHAPGTLAVTEAGGVAMHLNGELVYSTLSEPAHDSCRNGRAG